MKITNNYILYLKKKLETGPFQYQYLKKLTLHETTKRNNKNYIIVAF